MGSNPSFGTKMNTCGIMNVVMKTSNGLNVYHPQYPFDFWKGWSKVSDVNKLSDAQRDFLEKAKIAVSSVEFPEGGRFRRWDGDMRECYFANVNDGDMVVAWKQDNNGDTFMAFSYEPKHDFNKWMSFEAPSKTDLCRCGETGSTR